MSRIAHKLVASSGGKSYEIDQSLMFDRGDGAYIVRAAADITDGNHTTFTYSTWFKRVQIGSNDILFNVRASNGANPAFIVYIPGTEQALYVFQKDSGGNNLWYLETNRKLRDVGAWYHIVVAVDTTQGTAANRVKIYINGTQETFTGSSSYPSQNLVTPVNDGIDHQLGYNAAASLDGYLSETYLIDGTAQAVSEFGETDSATGAWIPKEYTGSFGNNGFYLPYKKNARYCPYFNAHASSGILTADHADFDVGSGNFTMECWFYVDEYAGNYRRVFGQSSSTGANAHTAYQVDIDSANKPVSYVYDAADNGTSYLTIQSQTTVSDNKWHHVALVRNGTAFNLYLDGTSVANVTSSITVNNSGYKFGIGRVGEYTSQIFKGWISNLRFVKGTAVYTSNFTPSTSPLTAITNTKLLCCQDSTATTENSGTSKTLEVTAAQVTTDQMAPFTFDWYQDQSGQNNHYQPDNLTVDDIMLDTPTNNFPTFNSLDNGSTTLTQGNLKFVNSSGNSDTGITMKVPHTGKWYMELRLTAVDAVYLGIWTTDYTKTNGDEDYGTGKQLNHTGGITGGSSGGYISGGFSNGDIIAMALDCDNGKIWWAKNNTYPNSGNPATGANQAVTFTATDDYKILVFGNSGTQNDINFGQNGTFNGLVTAQGNADGAGIGNFYYAPPSGFKALCSKNLPTPAVKKSSEHFSTLLYTGNDADDRTLTGVGFQPDLVWIKTRNATNYHMVFDSVRGISRDLHTNNNDVETVASDPNNSLVAFTSDGFTVDDSSGHTDLNSSSHTYVAWNWKAGGSGSANTAGSINTTSTSVNTSAGISISKYVGTGSNATVGHGLGVAPKTMWIKNRDTDDNWRIYFGDNTDYMAFNWTGGTTDDNTAWNDTSPTSTVFSIGTDTNTNRNGNEFVAYCFAEVDGFSKFGTYEGNNNANGPFIYTGFTPAWIIFKYMDNGDESWWMVDNKRDPLNPNTLNLFANLTGADYDAGGVDLLSNGFKPRATNGGLNGYTNTFFYMAFAESPFKYANAR